jgi:hypothetical protein
VPYSQSGANLLDDMIDRINAARPAFVVHVGDITSSRGPCSDEWLQARRKQFGRFQAPFVLLPGDNEWIDCRASGYEPLERMDKWRELFCVPVALGAFRRQSTRFCENVRWERDGHIFVGLNVPGANNNLRDDPAESAERMRAVEAWLDEAAALARRREGLVVIMHANPFLRPRSGVDGYAGLREKLAQLGRDMPGRVLLAHGDTHAFKDDSPLPGLRRTEVYGWPHIRWQQVRVQPGEAQRFAVERMP